MERDRPRSFQQAFVSLFQRRQRRDDDDFWALRDVSFNVRRGQSVGLIGSNGSGKSTSLKIIAKIIEPTRGTVNINGRVTALLELGAGFHPELSGRDNVYLNGAMMGLSREDVKRRLDSIVHFAELEDFIDVPVKHYSSGMYVRLGFSVSVHLEPEILLVDEVLAVGDASFQHKCMARIADLRRKGVTIVLVTHDLGAVQNLCEEAIWFDKSEMRAAGKPTDVVMSYLHDVAKQEEAQDNAAYELPALASGARWGSGKVQIRGVELRDAFDNLRATFLTGSSMRVRIRYHAPTRVHAPVFGLAVHHANGPHVTGPNSKFGGLYIPFVEGDGVVEYEIPSLPLLDGHYFLSVAVVDEASGATYDYHDRAYAFDVMPGKTAERYGLVTFNGTWRMEE